MFFFLLGILVYLKITWIGLYGGFVLDDFPNLERLEEVKNTGNLWAFTFSGVSSTLGRPASLLTFALQAQSWPDNPFNFKFINLIIHILNAVLVYVTSSFFLKLVYPNKTHLSTISLVISLYWLFLPVHASTVFYVVQRMTMLSTTFTLFGIVGFVLGRYLHHKGKEYLGLVIATVCATIGYFFGILAKENAILLGIYLLILNSILPRENVREHLWRIWIYLFSVLPLVLLVIYVFYFRGIESTYGVRDFNVWERLLTEPVILWKYLGIILVPLPSSLNIYNDGITISHGILDPPITALAIMLWVIVAFLTFVFRKKQPYIYLGVWWFLGGHLMESTVIGLELYFEHRNYLPSLGLIIAVVLTLYKYGDKYSFLILHTSIGKVTTAVGIVAIASSYSLVLRMESITWGDQEKFATAAVLERPESQRAWFDAANYFANKGDYKTSAGLVYLIGDRWSNQAGVLANKILLNCVDPSVVVPSKAEILDQIRRSKFDRGFEAVMREIQEVMKQGGCVSYSWSDYRQWLDAGIENALLSQVFRTNFVVLKSYSYNAQGLFKEAATALDLLDVNTMDIDYLYLKAQFNAMAGNRGKALSTLELIRNRFSNNPFLWQPRAQKIETLEKLIHEKVKE